MADLPAFATFRESLSFSDLHVHQRVSSRVHVNEISARRGWRAHQTWLLCKIGRFIYVKKEHCKPIARYMYNELCRISRHVPARFLWRAELNKPRVSLDSTKVLVLAITVLDLF